MATEDRTDDRGGEGKGAVAAEKGVVSSEKGEEEGADQATAAKGTQKVRFENEHYETIIEWLEDDKNFQKLYGVTGKTKVSTPQASKGAAYTELAKHLNSKVKKKVPGLDGLKMRARHMTYVKAYKKAYTQSKKSGFGPTAETKKKGLHTCLAILE